MKRQLLREGSSAPYLVGANYWASHAAHRMWDKWDRRRVERDLTLASEIGLNSLRTFFWTPQLSPFPGVVDEVVLERFDEFLRLANERTIGLFPTFFVGHMSGVNWDIPWRAGRDFCADPYMIYWECDLVSRVVRRFRGHPGIMGWILSNELPNYTGGMSAEIATVWTRIMHQAVKEADPNALISTGDGARCEVRPDYDGFRVEWVGDHVDWIGVHLYNYFKAEEGDNDELRKSYHIPCRIRYVDVGKPVLLEEFGLSDLISGDEEGAGYFRTVLYSSWMNGSCGALAWCLTDFDLDDEVPYQFQPHELFYGIATNDHVVKRRGSVLREFAGFASEHAIHEYEMIPPTEAIFVPYPMYLDRPHHRFDRLRYYRLLEEVFTLSKMAGLNPDFIRDVAELNRYRFVMIAGGRLGTPEWRAVERWVRSGGNLYYSYAGHTGGPYIPNFETLAGARQRIRFGQLDQPQQSRVSFRVVSALNPLQEGSEISMPRGPFGREGAFLPIEPTTASVIATDVEGNPALVRNRLGAGNVFFSTYPLEYMLLNEPDGNQRTSAYKVYQAMAAVAGAGPRFSGKHPALEATVLEAPGRDSLLAVVNHSYRDVRSDIRDKELNHSLSVSLASMGAAVYRLNETWRELHRPG